MTDAKTALVIGATGGIGGATAERLLAGGWRVRALNRDPARVAANRLAGLDWVKGDAMVAAEVAAAARGVSLIVHGANPPGYRNWGEVALPMLESTIAAAKAEGARILFPGTVYNYGPDAFPALHEDSPQHPVTRKGRIRVAMEAALAKAATEGARVLIVRAGDFFGPSPGNNWLSQGLIKPGQPLSAVTYPGPLGVPHAWGYLPDVAETMVRLAEQDAMLGDFEAFHMQGHQMTGTELVEALGRVAGRPVAVRQLPWLALRAAAPFNETLREMLEMRYLWRTPVLLDNSRLAARLGGEPHTPLDEALRAALAGMRVPSLNGEGQAAKRPGWGSVGQDSVVRA
ncbi:MAG: NAD-dependent epimerase/dehydratase family protein [Phenylobacterium sp.]